MYEASKALIRRLHDSRFATTYFVGDGIDIGAGDDSLGRYTYQFPLIKSIKSYELEQGNDAQFMKNIMDESFDFVHSSHCLEHMIDPYMAFKNWIRIVRPNGYLVITVPDEDLYEQGTWPSIYNQDHKTSWTIYKKQSWNKDSINVIDFLKRFSKDIEILKIELINQSYRYNVEKYDQSMFGISECAIEFVLRKIREKRNI